MDMACHARAQPAWQEQGRDGMKLYRMTTIATTANGHDDDIVHCPAGWCRHRLRMLEGGRVPYRSRPPDIGLTRFSMVFTVPSGHGASPPFLGEGFAVFGTLGFQELIIILVIVLIIFGAGRLPQIGEGVGKALKGFKKEVNESPPPPDEHSGQNAAPPSPAESASPSVEPASAPAPQPVGQHPARPGTEMTPGTLAASVYGGFGPETVQPPQPVAPTEQVPDTPYHEPFQPVTMEQRAASTVPRQMAQYPPVPPAAMPAAPGKRPAAIVNQKAVARVQARRAEMQQAKAARDKAATGRDDLQSLGEGLGGAVRTFREATADIRNAVDPEMRTIQAELESAHKEVEQSIESAKQPPAPHDPPPAP